MQRINKFHKSHYRAFTLVEIMLVIAIIAIPLTAVGILMANATKTWQQTYDSINDPIRQDAMAIMVAFDKIARQSNRINYKVYQINSGSYYEATPDVGSEVAEGQAVELRYWEDAFDPETADSDLFQYTNTGTHYALFYIDGTSLKADYGEVIDGVGAVDNYARVTAGLTNMVTFTEKVDINVNDAPFSHNYTGGAGNGCVRLNMTLTNDEGVQTEIKTAALLRVMWPR